MYCGILNANFMNVNTQNLTAINGLWLRRAQQDFITTLDIPPLVSVQRAKQTIT